MELSKEEKAARAAYYRKWRAKNPEKVQAAFKKYWLKKAEEIKAEEKKEE